MNESIIVLLSICAIESFFLLYFARRHVTDQLHMEGQEKELTDLRASFIDLKKERDANDKELKSYKSNPDRSIKILNDLMNNGQSVLKVERVDPREIYLRSPKEY